MLVIQHAALVIPGDDSVVGVAEADGVDPGVCDHPAGDPDHALAPGHPGRVQQL